MHNEKSTRKKWSFFYEKEQIEDLIKALNKRGFREGELKESLKCEEDYLMSLVVKTPFSVLNPEIEVKQDEKEERPVRNNGSTNKKKDR